MMLKNGSKFLISIFDCSNLFYYYNIKKAEEEMKKEAMKKKKDAGLLGSLLQQATGNAEKGGLEFSLANLFKCMCFTHEDPEDPKKQLVKVTKYLNKYFLHRNLDEKKIQNLGVERNFFK